MEGSSLVAPLASQAGTHLPSREGRNSSITQAVAPFPGDSTSSQAGSEAITYTSAGETLPKQVTTSPQVRQAVKLVGQAGKTPGIQPGIGPSRLSRETVLPPRQTALLPGKAILHQIPPVGFPKGLPQKPQPKVGH